MLNYHADRDEWLSLFYEFCADAGVHLWQETPFFWHLRSNDKLDIDLQTLITEYAEFINEAMPDPKAG